VSDPRVSIVLLTHNAGPDLDRVLDGVFSQDGVPPFEVIVIDTESTDGTLECLAKRPVRLERTVKHEFSHPGTRNRGVRLAQGALVVFLVQDAIPLHRRWLANLIAPLAEDPQVAAAYSRQVPRHGCNPVERRDIQIGAPPVRRVKRIAHDEPLFREDYQNQFLEFIMFSHVSSCARRALLIEYPLDERLPMVEDQEWCKRILEAGWTVVYEPTSVVAHSHDHTLRQVYGRHRQYGQAFARFQPVPTTLTCSVVAAVYESLGDYLFLWQLPGPLASKLRWIPDIPARRLAMKLGFHRGLRATSTAR
jgi:rhamnosyltransferase